MLRQHSAQFRKKKPLPDIQAAISDFSESSLRSMVETVSIPRHYVAERENNWRIREWIREKFESFGYAVSLHGEYQNVVATPKNRSSLPFLVAATHYDTVPGSPGADDNGSGIAVLLACAKMLAKVGTIGSTRFILFNREEDDLLGSTEFVRDYLKQREMDISETHVLEMVGFCSHEPNSQRIPPGLPVKAPDVGNFLGLVGNRRSNRIVGDLLVQARTYLEDFPVLGLKVYMGLERHFPHLQRSDHSPFWEAGIPALMWTDTSEFRNPNYHTRFDTPDTLDYTFMKKVAQLLFIRILSHERSIC